MSGGGYHFKNNIQLLVLMGLYLHLYLTIYQVEFWASNVGPMLSSEVKKFSLFWSSVLKWRSSPNFVQLLNVTSEPLQIFEEGNIKVAPPKHCLEFRSKTAILPIFLLKYIIFGNAFIFTLPSNAFTEFCSTLENVHLERILFWNFIWSWSMTKKTPYFDFYCLPPNLSLPCWAAELFSSSNISVFTSAE